MICPDPTHPPRRLSWVSIQIFLLKCTWRILFSVQANVAGVPAISIPCGVDKQGLPIGLQLIADDFEETKLLGFSKMILEMS